MKTLETIEAEAHAFAKAGNRVEALKTIRHALGSLTLAVKWANKHYPRGDTQPASGAKMPFPVPCLLDGKLETYQGPQDIAGFGFFGTPGATFYGAKMNRVQWLPPAVVTALNSQPANERKIAGLVEHTRKLIAHWDSVIDAEGSEFNNGAFDSVKDTLEDARAFVESLK